MKGAVENPGIFLKNEPKQLDEILRTVVGSGVHGIAIKGTDDHDEMGVFIEQPDQILGLTPSSPSYLWRTQPEGVRSGHGDMDLVRYSLRHYMRLATQGNPSILVPLYARGEDVRLSTKLGQELQDLAPAIISQRAGWRFLGYLNSQFERMQGGGKRNRVPKRPELVEKYGFDTKFASHALRLGLQGIELMRTHTLSLPMHQGDREAVRRLKTGTYDFATASSIIIGVRNELARIMHNEESTIPKEPDYYRINQWMQSAHKRAWRSYPEWR